MLDKDVAVRIVKEQATIAEREYVGTQLLIDDLTRKQNVIWYPFGKNQCDHGTPNHKDCPLCVSAELAAILEVSRCRS